MSVPPQPADDVSALPAGDRILLEACVAGRPGAWDAFVERFAGLFAFVADRTARQRGLSVTAADRDDVVAEILLACVRNDAAVVRAFRGRASLASYLTVIARRVTVRWLMQQSDRGAPPQRIVSPPDEAARIADREQIETLLDGLDGDEARLVRLHHLEQRSYGEISHLTGMPLGSIGPALSRARAKMRQGDRHPQAG